MAERHRLVEYANRLSQPDRELLLTFIWFHNLAPERQIARRLRRHLLHVLREGDSERISQWLRSALPALRLG